MTLSVRLSGAQDKMVKRDHPAFGNTCFGFLDNLAFFGARVSRVDIWLNRPPASPPRLPRLLSVEKASALTVQ